MIYYTTLHYTTLYYRKDSIKKESLAQRHTMTIEGQKAYFDQKVLPLNCDHFQIWRDTMYMLYFHRYLYQLIYLG